LAVLAIISRLWTSYYTVPTRHDIQVHLITLTKAKYNSILVTQNNISRMWRESALY